MIDQSTSTQTKQKKKYIAYLYHRTFEEDGTILAEGTDLFYDFFLDLTPRDIKYFGYIFAYNKDKDETYIVKGDGVRAEDGKYKFYTAEGKVTI